MPPAWPAGPGVDAPSCTQGSAAEAAQQALLCVDMQRDFVQPGAVLCVKGASDCLPRVVEAVDAARAAGVPVIWVVREHLRSGEGGGCGWLRAREACAGQGPHTGQPATGHACAGAGDDVELFRQHLFSQGPGATVVGSVGEDRRACAHTGKGAVGAWVTKRLRTQGMGGGSLARVCTM